MKNLLYTIVLFLITQQLKAQSLNVLPCIDPTAFVNINRSTVKSTTKINGYIFGGDNTSLAYNKIYQGRDVPVFFSASLWIGGMDASTGALKLAAQTYQQNGNDYWAGPLDNFGDTEASICNNFNRTWKFTKAEVDLFNADFNDNGVLDNGISSNILNWPAYGNSNNFIGTNYGELAPFFDRNSDGLYNPNLGDYPLSTYNYGNTIADETYFWVFNDNGDLHSESGAQSIQLQVNALQYYFNDAVVQNATYTDFKIMNKGGSMIDSTYIGIFADPDLGFYGDDYIGFDVANDFAYVYNADADDDIAQGGFGTNAPIGAMKVLKKPVDAFGNELQSKFMTYVNVNDIPNGNPTGAMHFYNYLSGTWGDGTRWTYGGNGYNSSTTPTDIFFPSSPNDNSAGAWSECQSNNAPDDRRFLYSFGSFRLIPGSNHLFTVLTNFNEPSPFVACNNLFIIENELNIAENFVENAVGINEINENTSKIEVLPNPANEYIEIKIEKENIDLIEIYSINKTLVKSGNSKRINITELTNGIYFVKVISKNNKIFVSKFIKQ